MALSEKRRKLLMAYCRIEELTEEEAPLLEAMYDAAVEYMADAGVKEPAEGSSRRGRYDLCINYLVLDAWDRRSETITGTIVAGNPAFRRMLNQLKFTE